MISIPRAAFWRMACGLVIVLAIIAGLFPVSTCMAAADQTFYRWRAGTLAPRQIGWARQVENIILPAFTKASNGHLGVKVFWGGIMGDDEDIIEKMRQDVLQIGGLAGQGSVFAIPEMAVLELPFLFNNFEEVDYIRDQMHTIFEKYAEKRGFKLFVWIDQDFDQVYSTKWPMDCLGAFRKSRFITWYGVLEEKVLKCMGAPFIHADVPDVSQLLHSGKADAVIAPALWMVGSQLQGVVRFVNPLKIRYSPVVIINTLKSWNAVPREYTGRLWRERMELSRRFVAQTRKDNEKALKAMLQYGVRLSHINAKDLKAVKKSVAPVTSELAGNLYPRSLIQEIRARLKAFRAVKKP